MLNLANLTAANCKIMACYYLVRLVFQKIDWKKHGNWKKGNWENIGEILPIFPRRDRLGLIYSIMLHLILENHAGKV